MSLTTDKGLGKKARREVSERLRAYHAAMLRMVEPDSEAFLQRVIERVQIAQASGDPAARHSGLHV
jgi:hypothetical protein